MIIASFILIASLLIGVCEGDAEFPKSYMSVDGDTKLELSGDSTFILQYSDRYLSEYRLDILRVIARGIWRCDNGLLLFSSPPELASSVLDAHVDELAESAEGYLSIEFDSPYDRLASSSQHYARVLNYVIFLSLKREYAMERYNLTGNSLLVPISDKSAIEYIWVTIVPDPISYPATTAFNYLSIPWIEMGTIGSSSIRISIPDLTLEYIGLMRFRDYVVRTGPDGGLFIDGRLYIPNGHE